MAEGVFIGPGLLNLMPLLAVLVLVGVPVLGLVIRYALSPLIQDLIRAIRGDARDGREEVAERLARMEQRLDAQETEIQRLAEAERFHQELRSGGPESDEAVEP